MATVAIPVHAGSFGDDKLIVNLTGDYKAGELGNILAPEGTTCYREFNGKEFLIIPGREDPLSLGFAVGDALAGDKDLSWTGPKPKP